MVVLQGRLAGTRELGRRRRVSHRLDRRAGHVHPQQQRHLRQHVDRCQHRSDRGNGHHRGTAAGGVDGTWVVDTETGEFDYESATGTFVGFRIEEELASIGSTTAVGRTGDVTGSMVIDGTTVTEASFEIDVSTITTNESRRDENASPLWRPASSHGDLHLGRTDRARGRGPGGEAVSATAVGDLTIHGVTQRVEFPLEAQLVQDTVVVVGSLDITFADYGVEVPDAQIVLSVEDHGILELQLLLTKS